MNIPDEAVEKAARVIARETFTADTRFDKLDQDSREFLRATARAALEDAAPHMLTHMATALGEATEEVIRLRGTVAAVPSPPGNP